ARRTDLNCTSRPTNNWWRCRRDSCPRFVACSRWLVPSAREPVPEGPRQNAWPSNLQRSPSEFARWSLPRASMTFDREFLARSPLEVAPRILGSTLTADAPEGRVTVRITEVEAYLGAQDPGSHAF